MYMIYFSTNREKYNRRETERERKKLKLFIYKLYIYELKQENEESLFFNWVQNLIDEFKSVNFASLFQYLYYF